MKLIVFPVILILVALAPAADSTSSWPSFRGRDASGVADGQGLPDQWNGQSGLNIKWKTRVPGLAHSSPVVWGDRVFVTTAVSSRAEAGFKPGLYGAGDASEDRSVHQWKVYCLDRKSGRVLWEKTAFEGVPREKRHIKSTYASSTPATDGRHVVAFFGSQGLYAFDVDGALLWKKDLGVLNVGAYDAPDYEWGTASSPVIYQDLVIVQCDTSGKDFLLACNKRTGETVWRVDREELPSWGTPTVCRAKGRDELLTNGSNYIRGYDPASGKELWRLAGSSKITAPTPICSPDLFFIASGRRPEAPIFAIRPGGGGELTPGAGTGKFVAWKKEARGPYMPTPLLYRGHLYVLGNAGVFDCYDYRNGDETYRQRLQHRGSGFSASPVAADGKIYLSSEDGDIFVVKAGAAFELVATNPMGELLMATPALSDRMMLVRGTHHVFAIGR